MQQKSKVVILGDSSVGKSSILYRLRHNEFKRMSDSTIGCEFIVHNVRSGENDVKLLLWDTAGQEVFRSFTKNFLRGATAVVIVFDVTNPGSFDSIIGWINEIKAIYIKPVVIIVGNKLDLGDKIENRTECMSLIDKCYDKIYYYDDISAKANIKVTSLFNFIGDKLIDDNLDILQNYHKEIVDIGLSDKPGNSCCI